MELNSEIDALELPGRTLLRGPDLPEGVDDDAWLTWPAEHTLPLFPDAYSLSLDGDVATVRLLRTGEVVKAGRGPLTLVECPVPF